MFQLGVLGLGYVAQRLMLRYNWAESSWAVGHHRPKLNCHYPWNFFDWASPSSWESLPVQADGLLLSIPPVATSIIEETDRLHQWATWMKLHRPELNRLVYLSSTSVIPNQPGRFNEDSPTGPASLKGKLRLVTEQILAQYFQLKVIRPAAIYGPERGIAARIKAQKPIPSDTGPIYRIHVGDLVRICELALTNPGFPPLVHAADPNPASSLEVAQWFVKRLEFQKTDLRLEEGYLARRGFGSHPDREIECLRLKEWGYQFQFPSYQEGLIHDESANP